MPLYLACCSGVVPSVSTDWGTLGLFQAERGWVMCPSVKALCRLLSQTCLWSTSVGTRSRSASGAADLGGSPFLQFLLCHVLHLEWHTSARDPDLLPSSLDCICESRNSFNCFPEWASSHESVQGRDLARLQPCPDGCPVLVFGLQGSSSLAAACFLWTW